MTVWFLTGLWHGAGWNFVLWGVYYGLLIYAEKKISPHIRWKVPGLLRHLYVILVTLFGWSFFYFTDFSRLWDFLQVMLGLQGASLIDLRLKISILNNIFFIAAAVIACLPVVPFLKKQYRRSPLKGVTLGIPLVNAALILISTVMLVGSGYNPFLYFRF
jgi:alginate O-acetyltransferase complex protein AlgI